MLLKQQLEATLVETSKNRQVTLTDECGRIYGIEYKYFDLEKKIVLEGVYITPTRTGGLKALLATYQELGIKEMVISKVINSKLAEYLFKEGWELKSSKYGNWIEFHKNFT